MHFYAWKNGLKTGMYYLRSRPAVDAIKFTLNVEELLKATDGNDASQVLQVMSKFEAVDKEVDLAKRESTTSVNITLEKKDVKYNKTEEEGCIGCSG